MALDKFELTFSDGEKRIVERRPIHAVRAEAILDGTAGTMTYVYAAMWAADTGGRGDRLAFEKWLEGLDDFERLDPEDADVDPPAEGPPGSPD